MTADRVVSDISWCSSEMYYSSSTWTDCGVRSHMGHHIMSTFLLLTSCHLKVYVINVSLEFCNLIISNIQT